MEELNFLRGPCRDVITGRFGDKSVVSQFCTGGCEERTCVGRRGISIVETVTRKRLVTD
jgi:hypothetical protein